MTRTTLNRLSGLALILAFALSLSGGLLHPIIDNHSHSLASMNQSVFPFAHLLIFLGGALLLLGLPAVYARIAERAGIVGLVGFALYFVVNATFIQFFTGYEAFVIPALAADHTTHSIADMSGPITASPLFAALQGIGGIGYMLGLLLLGIAVARAGVLPRWSGILMALAPVLLLLPLPELPLVTGLIIELPRGLAVAVMGYALITGERKTVVAPPIGVDEARQVSNAAS